MKILIIGSKGFIGRHCVSYFGKHNEVWGCDVVNDYNNNKYFLVDGTSASYSEVFQHHDFDICINCSGAASVPDSIKNPIRDFTLNTVNVFKQLDAIRKYSPRCKYINLSSAAVYGNPEKIPTTENSTVNPISPYGRHKKMAEDICNEFYTEFGIGVCNLRIFSAYGPGLKKQLLWDLNKKLLLNNEVLLYGTGKESRDFIYISDLVSAIDCIVNKSSFKADIVNVANGKEVYIHDVVKIFYNQIDESVKYKFGGENRAGDPKNWQADITKLKALGYKSKVDLKEGISKYIIWLNENR